MCLCISPDQMRLDTLLSLSPTLPRSYFLSWGQLSITNLRTFVIIFLSISINMCFGCSKEPSHRDGSYEYPQHMFWLRNKKNNFQLRTLILGPAYTVILSLIVLFMPSSALFIGVLHEEKID